MGAQNRAAALADAVLLIHLGVIAFNVAGLAVIPLGARRGWRVVRVRWLRALHAASLGVVALQALLRRACFLTLWEGELQRAAGGAAAAEPLIAGWARRAVYWPLPMWVFSAIYLAAFAATLVLWRWVPPERR